MTCEQKTDNPLTVEVCEREIRTRYGHVEIGSIVLSDEYAMATVRFTKKDKSFVRVIHHDGIDVIHVY